MVSERPDGARQRAGQRRRALRALRRGRRSAPAGAVVPAHHRLRRAAVERPRRHRLARARQDDAAQLDRAQRGGGGDVPLRGASDRLSRVHDPPGHAVRGDVLRDGARAPGRAATRAGHRAPGRGAEVRQPRDHRVRRAARERREAEDGRAAGTDRHQPGQRRADPDVCGRLRADGVRDGRDHGGAGTRRARLRVRAGVRAADQTGDRRPTHPTSGGGAATSRGCHIRGTARWSTPTRSSTGWRIARR